MITAHRRGFSIVEILIVVTIIGILSIGVFSAMTYIRTSKINTTKQMIRVYQTAIDSFHNDTGSYPVTLSDLVDKPADQKIAQRWQGPYIKKVVTQDAFNKEFVYNVTKGGKTPYELYSWGENGEGSQESEWIDVWKL